MELLGAVEVAVVASYCMLHMSHVSLKDLMSLDIPAQKKVVLLVEGMH